MVILEWGVHRPDRSFHGPDRTFHGCPRVFFLIIIQVTLNKEMQDSTVLFVKDTKGNLFRIGHVP